MSAFQEKDCDYFFGRETFVEGTKDRDGLIQVVHKQPLVAVIGSSGSGKSSVIFAGLIPKLRAEGIWLIESFRPQSQPFYLLASALVRSLKPELDETQQPGRATELFADMTQGKLTAPQIVANILERHPNKRLLLVVDQFEELYTLCQDTQEQQRFVDALLAMIQSAPRKLTVILTLRADFLSYVLNYHPFGEALRQHTPLLLSAMSRGEMRAAIELPAQQVQVQMEERLTEVILNDVKQEPGNLPLLEFALTQLWAKQSQGKLTHQAYQEIGGVAKALVNHAEAVYAKLSEVEQKQAQRIFLQLVRPGEGTEDTRRLATRAEVGNWELVIFLAGAEARLVVTGWDEQTKEEKVELVHEALIQQWGRLCEWMKTDRKFRVWQERLRSAVRQWKGSDKDEGALWRGVLLAESEDWQQKRSDELTQEERDFIQASVALREREREEQERSRTLAQANEILTQAQQKANRRIRIGAIILGVSIIGAIIAGVYAGYVGKQAWESIEQADEAKLGLQLEQQGVQAQKQFEEGNQLGALLAATRIGKQMQAKVRDGRPLEKYFTFSPLFTLQSILLDIQERIQLPHKDGGSGSVSVSFSPDGEQIATGSNGTVQLWNQTGEKLSQFKLKGEFYKIATKDKSRELHFNSYTMFVCFSSNGVKSATTTPGEDNAIVWDSSGKKILDFKPPVKNISEITFSPDCNLIAFRGLDNNYRSIVSLWNLAGKNIAQLNVQQFSFSPDSKQIATIERDDTLAENYPKVRRWNQLGQQIGKEFEVRISLPSAISFNGNKIATLSYDKKVLLWDLSGNLIGGFQPSRSIDIQDLTLSPDGNLLVTRHQDNILRLWTIGNHESYDDEKKPFAEFKGEFQNSSHLEFSPDSKQIAITGFTDRTVKLYNSSKKQYTEFNTSQFISQSRDEKAQIKFSSDGKTIVTSGYGYDFGDQKRANSNSVLLWNLSGQRLAALPESYINKSDQIVTRGSDGLTRVLNLSGEQLAEVKVNKYSYVSVSPDGKKIVTADPSVERIVTNNFFSRRSNEGIKVWNSSGQKLAAFNWNITFTGGDSSMPTVYFSPDSKQIAMLEGMYGYISLWNLSGKQIAFFDQGDVSNVNFSPDGKQIVLLGDRSVSIWNRELQSLNRRARRIAVLKEKQESVSNIAFSPDWKFIATVGEDRIVRLWNHQSWDKPRQLKGHEETIRQIRFSPDGQRIVTLDAHKIRVWSLSGEQITQFEEHKGSFLDVAFSPDGKQLAVLINVVSSLIGINGYSQVRILPVGNLDSLLKDSCNLLKDYLHYNPYATDEDRQMCGISRQ